MKNSYFSIIVPVYNSEKYIKETIDSVVHQTSDDWELILVDDGSTDKSGMICDQEAKKSDKIKVVHTKNNGGLEARYRGVKESTGEYVVVIDADDRMCPDCLIRAKEAIEISDADMVIWGFRTFGAEDREVKFSLKPNRLYSQTEILYTSVMDTYHSLWTRAVRGNIMRESCTCELGKLSINTDYAMLIPILGNIRNAYVIDKILYEYRIYHGSVSHSLSVKKVIDTDQVTEYAVNVFSELGIYDHKIEEAVLVSYLKMIGGRILDLFIYGDINRKQCRVIHALPMYKRSKSYETKEYFKAKELLIMKLFRHSIYVPFYGLFLARTVKNCLKEWMSFAA